MNISPAGRRRVAQILRLLSTDIREERDAAVLALCRALEAEGLGVGDLADEVQTPPRQPRSVRWDAGPATLRAWTEDERVSMLPVMRDALRTTSGVARDFLERMIRQFEERPHLSLTARQQGWLEAIVIKASRRSTLNVGDD